MENKENMKKSVVSSFDVDHRTLKEGLYLRSVYEIDDRHSVRSWDLRFCAPSAHKPLCPGTVHTIEHLMAYYLRLDEKIGKSVVSFCPMGCLTGFYLSTTGDVEAEEIRQLKKATAEQKAANLPEQMIQNIAKGRMAKFYKDSCLLDQEFIQDSKLSVADYLKAADKELTVVAFKRFTLRAE